MKKADGEAAEVRSPSNTGSTGSRKTVSLEAKQAIKDKVRAELDRKWLDVTIPMTGRETGEVERQVTELDIARNAYILAVRRFVSSRLAFTQEQNTLTLALDAILCNLPQDDSFAAH